MAKKKKSKKSDRPEPESTPAPDAGKRKNKGDNKGKDQRKPGAGPAEMAVEVSPPVEATTAPTDEATGRDEVAELAVHLSETLRVGPGFDLAALDPSSTPGFRGDRDDAEKAMAATAEEISNLQERLYAEAKGGGKRSLLVVVQGLDTSGKGGIMRHVIGLMDPQGVDITAFKAPTREERAHPFLWRIRNALPRPGQIGVFDRSQYEDVLIVRVHNLVPPAVWGRRYGQINAFEKTTQARGTSIVKIMLAIGKDEQRDRLAERLERPDKYWKFNPGDIDERARWDDYQEAYQAVLDKTSTSYAPWFVVPADHKWYARLAVQNIILAELRAMDPQWPAAEFDIAEQQARLAAT